MSHQGWLYSNGLGDCMLTMRDFSQCCDCMLRVVASIFRLMRVIFYNVTHAGWLHAKGGRTHFPCDVRDFS